MGERGRGQGKQPNYEWSSSSLHMHINFMESRLQDQTLADAADENKLLGRPRIWSRSRDVRAFVYVARLQVCGYARMRVCAYARVYVCMCARMNSCRRATMYVCVNRGRAPVRLPFWLFDGVPMPKGGLPSTRGSFASPPALPPSRSPALPLFQLLSLSGTQFPELSWRVGGRRGWLQLPCGHERHHLHSVSPQFLTTWLYD